MKDLPRVLVADPAWAFDDKLPDLKSGRARGAAGTYRTVTPMDRVLEQELPDMHPDSFLFLWRVAAMAAEALEVMRAWGFEYKTELVWVKETRAEPPLGQDPKLAFGMGHYVRGAHEVCLIGRRGKAQVKDRGVRSVLYAPVGAHSEKPDAFYALVERLCAGPYHEMHARRRRPGWTYSSSDELPHEAAQPAQVAAEQALGPLAPYGDVFQLVQHNAAALETVLDLGGPAVFAATVRARSMQGLLTVPLVKRYFQKVLDVRTDGNAYVPAGQTSVAGLRRSLEQARRALGLLSAEVRWKVTMKKVEDRKVFDLEGTFELSGRKGQSWIDGSGF